MPVYTLLYIPTILSDYPKMTKNETKLEQKHLRHPPPTTPELNVVITDKCECLN